MSLINYIDVMRCRHVDIRKIYSAFIGCVLILGSTKIFPAPIWDDFLILLFGIFFLRQAYQGANLYTFIFACFVCFAIIGSFEWNIASMRFVSLGFGMLLLSTFKPIALDICILKKISYLYIAVTILFPILGYLMSYPIAWWQDYLWVGTAYAAYYVYIAGIVLIQFAQRLSERIVALYLIYLSAIFCDSRATLLVLIILVGHSCLITKGLWSKVKLISLLLGMILLTQTLINYSQTKFMGEPLFQVEKIFFSKHETDNGRRDQNSVLFSRSSKDTAHSSIPIIGYGSYSHQTILLEYLDADTSGIVRPTGVPALLIDYGLLFALAVILGSFWNAFKGYIYTPAPRLLNAYLGFELIAVSLAFLFVTNLVDSVLFWIVMSGSFFSSIMLTQLCKSESYYPLDNDSETMMQS